MSTEMLLCFMLTRNRHGGKCVAPTGGSVFEPVHSEKKEKEKEKKKITVAVFLLCVSGSDEETAADLHLDFGMTTPRGNK